MKWYVGVDGGQSSTVAAIGDERGVVVARGIGPPADLVGEPRDSRRQAQAIDRAVARARQEAGLPDDTVFAAIVCGISGYEEKESAPSLTARATRVRIAHDAEIALAGALGGEPGVVVVAGTGSVALGLDERGERVRVGGWGFLFGDEGSAFWIARSAVTSAMRREDVGETSELGVRALSFFEQPSLRAIQTAFHHNELSRATLAAFTPSVLAAARERDPDAMEIANEAVQALADLAECADARMEKRGARRVSYAGGVFADETLREAWRAALRKRIPGVAVVEPIGDAATGALRLAVEEAVCER